MLGGHDLVRVRAHVVGELARHRHAVDLTGDRYATVHVSDRRVDEVEDQDRDDLEPPVEDVRVAQHARAGKPRSPAFDLGTHDDSSTSTLTFLRFPTANDG